MNTANLQLEGLYLAIAALNHALVRKGVLTQEEVDAALLGAERTVLADDRAATELSGANRAAVLFPLRLLRLANDSGDEEATLRFSELARQIGEMNPQVADH